MEDGAVKCQERGRLKQYPQQMVGDKGYSSSKIRRYFKRRGIESTLAHRSNEKRIELFGRYAYYERNRLERLINRLKQFRQVATRYEKRAANYWRWCLPPPFSYDYSFANTL